MLLGFADGAVFTDQRGQASLLAPIPQTQWLILCVCVTFWSFSHNISDFFIITILCDL